MFARSRNQICMAFIFALSCSAFTSAQVSFKVGSEPSTSFTIDSVENTSFTIGSDKDDGKEEEGQQPHEVQLTQLTVPLPDTGGGTGTGPSPGADAGSTPGLSDALGGSGNQLGDSSGQTGSSPFDSANQGFNNAAQNSLADVSQTPQASLPNVIGDFFDGGARTITLTEQISTSFFASGAQVGTNDAGVPVYAFERDMEGFPDDLFTDDDSPLDLSGDEVSDFYSVGEPLPPTEVPTSPGPEFTYDGGTATYTNSTDTTDAVDGEPMDGDIWFIEYSYSQEESLLVPAGGGGVAVRRFKISENNSPLPQDRLFFNYSFFNDVTAGFGDVSRFTLGAENTFLDGLMSWEIRVPFAATLDNEQRTDMIGTRDFEFGNPLIAWKALLLAHNNWYWASGSGITLPIASGTDLQYPDGRHILRVSNESVHFLPYTAVGWLSNVGFFEAFLQFDYDAHGDAVYANSAGVADRTNLPRIGTLQDSTIMFLDVAAGSWLWRSPDCFLSGFAPVVEMHYATTLQDADTVAGNGVSVGDISRRIDILNLTLGAHAITRNGCRLTTGVVLPLRDDDDRPFDYEAVVQLNWYL